ncbi:hypothetical protein [Haloferax mediterranei]
MPLSLTGHSQLLLPTSSTNNSTESPPANAAASQTPPGQKLAAVIGVQGSETDGELERRAFETRLSKANSNSSKAAVVAQQVETVRGRLTDLQQRKARLDARRENGTIPEGQYRVKMTRTVADIERTKSMLNRTSDAASSVPAEALRERGVDTADLDRLRTRASELTGPEVAEMARGLTGDNPGKGLERARSGDDKNESDDNRGRPNDVGPGAVPGNGNSGGNNSTENASDTSSSNKKSGNGPADDDRTNSPDTPPGRDAKAKDADHGNPFVTTDDESTEDGTEATADGDTETTTADSETSSTDDSNT